MFIHAVSLPPDMFTQPQQDANVSLFILWPWCNVIRERTPPAHKLLISFPWQVAANYYPFTPKCEYAYSPYCSVYISQGADKENMLNNHEL